MQPIRADLFGTIVFAAIALLWTFNALRGLLAGLGARTRSRTQRAPLQALSSSGAKRGAQRSPLQTVFRRLSSISNAGAADFTLRRVSPAAAKSASLPAPSSIRTPQTPGPAAPANGPSLQAPGPVSQFDSPLWLQKAVIAAVVLEPCAAHKGAGHEPGDW